ncbi:cupin domain-containing protein [Azotosporobacter soli]|uniref:cupin domain-containing protein n=1 Tax=Azotosporobacter soli TaxID=3055040 RepID=UPI0031FF0E08
MKNNANNYSLLNLDERDSAAKLFVGESLQLSGCEVSFNRLAAGEAAPFVHAHKKNEELYIITAGSGLFYLDGEEIAIRSGSLIRVAPAASRAWKAGDNGMEFICIQTEAGSLHQATRQDGIICDAEQPSWAK